MIDGKFADKTMSAQEWIRLLDLQLHVCDYCNGFTPTVIEPTVAPEWFPLWRLMPPSEVVKVCLSCNQGAESKKQRYESKLEQERHGIIEDSYGNFLSKSEKVGWVYVCEVRSGIYKIGFTESVFGVRSRVKAQKDLRLDGLVATLALKNPRSLEGYLHRRFSIYRVDKDITRERFGLSKDHVAFIKGIRVFNNEPVSVTVF